MLKKIYEAWLVLIGDVDWHVYTTGMNGVTLPNGDRLKGYVMRRRVRGTWQYREVTAEESTEAAWFEANGL